MTKSAYIHIPFCNKICSYCDFSKFYNYKEFIDKYLISLEKEIKSIYKGEVLDTIYIGGGTPTVLELNDLEKLLKILTIFNKSKSIEYTIESNIDTLSKEKLDLLKKYNINRISIGIETTNNKLLKLLNRDLNKKHLEEMIHYSKTIGIDNINLDLIYALPGEKMLDLKKDLEYITSLNPKHISTYSLIIEQHTVLNNLKYKNIDEELDLKMYNYICNYLKDKGYIHYEISNFSKPGYESKHNLVYWNNNTYYGFGIGASSYIDNKRITNTRSLNKYFNNNYIKEEELLNRNDIIDYEIILNLRLKDGIDLKLFKDKYNINLIDIYNYDELINNKLLELNNNHLYIPEDKLYISNTIIVKLLDKRI